MIHKFKEYYESIFEPQLIAEMLSIGTFKSIKAGDYYLQKNSYLKGIPLIISGALKVLREGNRGYMFLYFLTAGETYSLSMSTNSAITKSEVCAVAELDTEMLVVPIEKTQEWILQYASWRTFVLTSNQNSLKEMLAVIDDVAFLKKEYRLYNYLNAKSIISQTDTLNFSHKEIADDLYSSRVVISRLLKNLEKQGKVILGRNKIKII